MAQSMGALYFELSCLDREQVQACFLKTTEHALLKRK
jgi:hypothetical protein